MGNTIKVTWHCHCDFIIHFLANFVGSGHLEYLTLKVLDMRNLLYEIGICQKAIIKSQRQFMGFSNFNE